MSQLFKRLHLAALILTGLLLGLLAFARDLTLLDRAAETNRTWLTVGVLFAFCLLAAFSTLHLRRKLWIRLALLVPALVLVGILLPWSIARNGILPKPAIISTGTKEEQSLGERRLFVYYAPKEGSGYTESRLAISKPAAFGFHSYDVLCGPLFEPPDEMNFRRFKVVDGKAVECKMTDGTSKTVDIPN